jgi:hypothetical protein
MNNFIEGIKLFGGMAGLFTLGWKILEEFKTYLRLKVEVSFDNKRYTVLTEIENNNKLKNKKIENAFLLISPEKSDLISIGKAVAENLQISQKITSTNNFEYLRSDKPLYLNNKIAFIPLNFYYAENIAIGDEKLTYRCSIDANQLEKGIYSIRFYIFGERRYHRSTQDLLSID